MPAPIVAAAATILSFIAKKGFAAAIKKYGTKAVRNAEKQQAKKIEKKAKKSRDLTEKSIKEKNKKLDPGFDPKATGIMERSYKVEDQLEKAIKAGKPQKEIDGLRARLKNLKDMLEDNPEDLVDDLSRGFKRGGLAKSGSADYRKKGLFY